MKLLRVYSGEFLSAVCQSGTSCLAQYSNDFSVLTTWWSALTLYVGPYHVALVVPCSLVCVAFVDCFPPFPYMEVQSSDASFALRTVFTQVVCHFGFGEPRGERVSFGGCCKPSPQLSSRR